jgi:transcriptional repressor NrdR
MKCPACQNNNTRVVDSRPVDEYRSIRRRRECLECQKRFTTFETVDLTIQVHKRDGRYEDFQQDKLIRGLDAACRHTRISHDQVRTLAAQITADLMERQVREIETTELGELVINYLKELDTIAFIRFACVYRRFKDMDELMDEIQSISSEDEVSKKE